MTVFHVTTTATAQGDDGDFDCGVVTHELTAAEVAAGKYKLETEEGAAHRIARDRHLDQLDADRRLKGLTLLVDSARR
jgi:hypothetical protein